MSGQPFMLVRSLSEPGHLSVTQAGLGRAEDEEDQHGTVVFDCDVAGEESNQ